MIRQILLTLLVSLVGFTASAQTYKALWSQAETAATKDGKPKTALATVRTIHEKALSEGNDAELLRAATAEVQLLSYLSPDSVRHSLQSLREAAEREQRPAVRALWHSTLGRLHVEADRSDTALVNRGRSYLRASVADVPLLGGASARDYLPLFIIGKDSHYYNDDLLSVVAQAFFDSGVMPADECRELYGKAIAYYRGQSRPAGELFMTLDSIDCAGSRFRSTSPTAFRDLRALAGRFESLPENVETYVRMLHHQGTSWATDSTMVGLLERGLQLYGKTPRAALLRNALQEYRQQTLHLQMPAEQVYPGEQMVVQMDGKNLSRVTFRLYRTRLTTAGVLQMQAKDDRRYDRHVTGKPTVITREFAERPIWQTYHDSITLSIPEAGIYLLEARVGKETCIRHLIHVSRVRTLGISEGKEKARILVVDGRDGHPLPDTDIVLYRNGVQQKVLTPDAEGFIHLSGKVDHRMNGVGRSGSDIYAAPEAQYRLYAGYYYRGSDTNQRETRINLFTDRHIYRPGQQVQFGGVIFWQQGDSLRVLSPYEMTATLCNAQGKEVATMSVFADEMGHFKGDFTLPAAVLPGYFSIRIKGQDNRVVYQSFRVEEYKRPTITADLQQPTEAYMLGDTVRLAGTVRSYTDMPIAGARVRWSVKRSAWYYVDDSEDIAPEGETVTDSTGHFTVPVPLFANPRDMDARIMPYNRFFYEVRYTVTADNGESVDGQTVIQASTKRAVLTDEWPESVCRESLPRQRYNCVGSMGQQLERTVHYRLWRLGEPNATDSTCVAEGDVRTGETFLPKAFPALPSGRYRWQAEAMDSTERLRVDRLFTLFSMTDTRPVVRTSYFQYVQRSTKHDSATVLIGTSADSTYLYYTLIAGGRILESERYCLSDSLRRFDLGYRPEYGESARACFAILRDGQLHTLEVDIERPVPDKDLRLTWSTFRDHVTPGAAEEWRLRVTYPDGRPADAALIARMYDRSLDAFGRNPWAFNGIRFYRMPQNVQWYSRRTDGQYLTWGETLHPERNLPQWKFTTWNLPDFATSNRVYKSTGIHVRGSVRRMQTSNLTMNMVSKAAAPTADMAALEEKEVESDGIGNAGAANGGAADDAVRTGFAETALFATSLHTDNDGQVTLAFRMPESLTSWRLEALAHTATMEHGRMDTVIVAQRKLMVQPALPRFLRAGDRVSLPVTVSNLSDAVQEVNVTLYIHRASDGSHILTDHKRVSVGVNGRGTVTFECAVPAETEADGWTIRIVGQSTDYSDGEEHELPVFSHRREVTRTLPFSLPGKASRTLRLDTLWRVKGMDRPSMTIETVANPTWYAVDALPTILQVGFRSCDSWGTRLYALSVAHHIASQSPEVAEAIRRAAAGDSTALPRLRGEGLDATTPWLRAGEREALRRSELINLFDDDAFAAHRATAVDQLRALQTSEGGWAWFHGMKPNLYMTLDVATLLARTEALGQDADVAAMLKSAQRYLHTAMEQYVERDRRNKSKSADGTIIRYLYLCALTGQPENATTRYLLKRAEEWNAELSVYDKSLLATTLYRLGRRTDAERLAASLVEYTVSSPEMGRWFDANRDRYAGSGRQIMTQSAAIEALATVPGSHDTAIDEMKLWLMQNRHTQMWDQPRMAADAVYALLVQGKGTGTLVQPLGNTAPVYLTLNSGRNIVDAPAQSVAQGVEGLTRRTYDRDSHPALFTVSKRDEVTLKVRSEADGLSWGSVVVTYTQPASEVKAASAGMSVQTTVEVLRAGGRWQALKSGTRLNVGDRVRQVCRFTADRDYDFVRIALPRPACFAPVRPLSGYEATGSVWYYRAMGDDATDCFIEHLGRGSHVLTEEYDVDRAGEFHTGCTEISSVYNPEFRGNDSDHTVRAGR